MWERGFGRSDGDGVGHLEEDVELVREESRSRHHALARLARSLATLADAMASKTNYQHARGSHFSTENVIKQTRRRR